MWYIANETTTHQSQNDIGDQCTMLTIGKTNTLLSAIKGEQMTKYKIIQTSKPTA